MQELTFDEVGQVGGGYIHLENIMDSVIAGGILAAAAADAAAFTLGAGIGGALAIVFTPTPAY